MHQAIERPIIDSCSCLNNIYAQVFFMVRHLLIYLSVLTTYGQVIACLDICSATHELFRHHFYNQFDFFHGMYWMLCIALYTWNSSWVLLSNLWCISANNYPWIPRCPDIWHCESKPISLERKPFSSYKPVSGERLFLKHY